MTEQQLQELKAALERVRVEHGSTPEKARQFLKDEGFLDETGELAKPYKPESH